MSVMGWQTIWWILMCQNMEGKGKKTICCKCQRPRLAGNTSDRLNYEIHLPLWVVSIIYLSGLHQADEIIPDWIWERTENLPSFFRVVDATVQKNDSDNPAAFSFSGLCLFSQKTAVATDIFKNDFYYLTSYPKF